MFCWEFLSQNPFSAILGLKNIPMATKLEGGRTTKKRPRRIHAISVDQTTQYKYTDYITEV